MRTLRVPASVPLSLSLDRLQTPVGELLIAVDDRDCLRLVHFDAPADVERFLRHTCGVATVAPAWRSDPGGATHALRAYFAGDLGAIDALRVAPAGTAFQREVWRMLRTIPCGTTTSYGALAHRLGRPDASRAVGAANGANPIAIVVPCHRVIGADGSLTGYGGGLDRKRVLLAHESQWTGRRLF